MNLQFLTIWKNKIKGWSDSDRNKLDINPPRDWIWLFSLGVLALVIVFIAVFFFRNDLISKLEEEKMSNYLTEKLNDQKLKIISNDYNTRMTEREKLQDEKPAVADPGI